MMSYIHTYSYDLPMNHLPIFQDPNTPRRWSGASSRSPFRSPLTRRPCRSCAASLESMRPRASRRGWTKDGYSTPRIFRPVNLTFTDILHSNFDVKTYRFSPRGEFRMVHVFGFRQAHHRIRYSEEALQSCVKFASQYIQDRPGDRLHERSWEVWDSPSER